MDFTIRIANARDYEAVTVVYRQVSYLHAKIHPELFSKVKDYVITAQEFCEMLDNRDSFVFVVENAKSQVIGFSTAIIRNGFAQGEKILHISELGVLSKYKRHGIGRKLIEHLEQIAKEHNCARIELNVFNNNEAAKCFYKNMGFNVQNLKLGKPIK